MWRWTRDLVRTSPSRIAALPQPTLKTLDSQYRFHRCAYRSASPAEFVDMETQERDGQRRPDSGQRTQEAPVRPGPV
ncbi:hypothetical protein CK203_004482 [Vitis vinifera]|uniref:Uncharacterized protein n=1 Tax=Vitis vinifera TaxID=29760 RepID=A0A438KFU9_VITVI|nr:hypothetical protein CK203_004482 [Vitis vinifera]